MIKAILAFWMAIYTSVFGGMNSYKPYTVDDVKAALGHEEDALVREDFQINNQECVYVCYANTKTEVCERPEYYVFKNEKAARKAYEYMKEKWIGDVTEERENYIQGWEIDVCDACIETFIYLHHNMIITADVTLVGCWIGPDEECTTTKHSEVKQYILNTWRD